ncbi:MAG: hypothetical protein ABIP28_15040 [Mucilaginibacter sp.]
MKKEFFGLLIILLVIIAGCTKVQEQPPLAIPEGKFTGKFTRLHLNPSNNKIDTLSANFVITFSAATGYAVLSDTSIVHAGSKGSYIVDPYFMQFTDSTIPAGPVPTTGKTHLAGVYDYYYKSPVLKFSRTTSDTLGYSYDLILTP